MKNSMNMKRWVVVFRALANINRLEIIRMLSKGKRMSVTDISNALEISFKATSNHLAILKNLGVLEAEGAVGHVFYSLSRELPKDFREAVDLFLK